MLLPQAIGVRTAREMSFTGNYVTAGEALNWGLVNRVVPHHELLATAHAVANDIVGNDQPGVQAIRATYAAITRDETGWNIEAADGAQWRSQRFSTASVAARREQIMSRGRSQVVGDDG